MVRLLKSRVKGYRIPELDNCRVILVSVKMSNTSMVTSLGRRGSEHELLQSNDFPTSY